MFFFKGSAGRKENGQGLIEYALLLVFIALTVIVIVAIFGEAVTDTYCHIIAELGVLTDQSGGCDSPRIRLRPQSQGPNHLNLEADITDPDGDPDDPYGAIDRVEFYIDDTSGSPVQTEYHFRYCLGGGPNGQPCDDFDTSGLSPGSHVIIIIAYDNDGNSSTSRFTYVH